MLRHRPKGTAKERRGSGAELVDAEEQEEMGEAEDITMTESATMAATGTETEAGGRATNDQSDVAQLRQVIRVDHCGDGDRGRTNGGHSVLAGATEGMGK